MLTAVAIAAGAAPTLAQPVGELPAAEPVRPEATSGGVLDLDRSVERLLQQAESLAAQKRYSDAVALWQNILDHAGHGLFKRKDLAVTTFGGKEYQLFQPVRAEIERRIVRLPPAGLEAYRRDVDGSATAAFEQARGRAPGLQSEAVDRYLLSSSGDAAAYALACLHLDRGEFVRASRLLRRLRDGSRRPAIGEDRLLVRLALADAALGDPEGGRRWIDELQRVANAVVPSGEVEQAAHFVARAAEASRRDDEQDPRWPEPPGLVSAADATPALPATSYVDRLTESWTRSVAIEVRERSAAGVGRDPVEPATTSATLDGRTARFRATVLSVEDRQPRSSGEAGVVERWTKSRWVPAGDVLIEGDRAYFKGAERLIAVDTASGRVRWLGLRNRFELSWSSQAFGQAAASAGGTRPATPEDIRRFGDRIHHSLSLSDGTVYSLEGPLVDFDSDATVSVGAPEASRAIVRRSLENHLAAYDARTGRLKWQCQPSGAGPDDTGERGFVAAPVRVRDRLVAPVSRLGELWLYGLDPDRGEVVWRVFLCDEPPGGCSPWAAVAMAVDGGELYVASGAGLVFAIDGASGRVEWAVEYQRNGIRNMQVTRPGAGFVVAPELDGWERDAVFVHGPRIVVMPSDYSYMVALDRRDGRLLWHSPRQPSEGEPAADCCLGIVGDGLFVAGRNVVRRYDLPSGRLVWQTATGDSHGRGAVTRDAVYVPAGDAVVRLDLATGSELSRSALITSSPEPVGNLYSDGQRLLCLSGERLYALTGLETQFDRLGERIAGGSAAAQLERMHLHFRLEQLDEAIADLRAAARRLREQEGPGASRRALFDGMSELGLPRSRPQLVLELIAEAGDAEPAAVPRPAGWVVPGTKREPALGAAHLAEDAAWRRAQLLHAALRALADEATSRLPSAASDRSPVEAILGVARFCRPAYLQLTARRAIAAAASESDGDVLREALGAEDPSVRLLAVSGLATVLKNDEEPPFLRRLLDDADEAVRFEAALALANRGERGALPVLTDLLESEDAQLRNRSLATLRSLTGRQFGYVASAPAGERAEQLAEWRRWIAEDGETAALRFPVRESGLMLGRTLIAYTNNRVVELDEQGRVVWQQEVANPWSCQGLPNGHRLVASYTGRSVHEYDADGRLVWQRANLPSSPYSVERLDNGHTLVACYSANKLLELGADGSVVHEIAVPDNPRDATRLANGNTLVALYMSQRVAEIDPDGQIVWEAGDMNRPVAVQRLDNGHTLVCQSFGRQVVEIDGDGTIVWSKAGLEYPYDAQRLPTGNTLIVDRTGVQEVDPTGRTVWQQPGSGATSVCRY